MFTDQGGSSSPDRVDVVASGGLRGRTGADAADVVADAGDVGSARVSDRRAGGSGRGVDGRVAAAEEGVSLKAKVDTGPRRTPNGTHFRNPPREQGRVRPSKQANSLADAAGYFSKVSAIGRTPAHGRRGTRIGGRRGSESLPVGCDRLSNPAPLTSFTICGTTSVSMAVGRSKTRASSTNTRWKTFRRRVWKSLVIGGIDRVARAVRKFLNRSHRPGSPRPMSGRAPGC